MSTTVFLMTVLLLLVILTADALRFRFRQREMQKHDRVLFPFCQLRRDVMSFLYRNSMKDADSLSPSEYGFIRQLLNVLDATIHNYNQHKTSMFNLRKIAKHLETYRKASETALKVPDHPEVQEFHQRIHRLLVVAFLAYTPLIRWELALRLIVLAGRIGYRVGKQEALRREAEYIAESAEKVREDARHYNVSLHYA